MHRTVFTASAFCDYLVTALVAGLLAKGQFCTWVSMGSVITARNIFLLKYCFKQFLIWWFVCVSLLVTEHPVRGLRTGGAFCTIFNRRTYTGKWNLFHKLLFFVEVAFFHKMAHIFIVKYIIRYILKDF